MRLIMLILGIIVLLAGVGVALGPMVMSSPAEDEYKVLADDIEAYQDDNPDASEEDFEKEFDGRNFWVSGEVIGEVSQESTNNNHSGDDVYSFWIGESGMDEEDCIDLDSFELVCFPASSTAEVSEGDSGVFYIVAEDSGVDCTWEDEFDSEEYDCGGFGLWLQVAPGTLSAASYGGGGVVALLGLILVIFGLRGGKGGGNDPYAGGGQQAAQPGAWGGEAGQQGGWGGGQY